MISDTAALARSLFALFYRSQADWLLSQDPSKFTLGVLQHYPGTEQPVPQNWSGPHIDCDYWVRNLSRYGRLRLVGAAWGASRFGMSQSQLVDAISDGCLRINMQAQNMARFTTRGPRPAGEISLPQGGAQWGGLAFIGAMFGLFYWGLRAESPEEKAAYEQMKARHNPSVTSGVYRIYAIRDGVVESGRDRGEASFRNEDDIRYRFAPEDGDISTYSVAKTPHGRGSYEVSKNGRPFALIVWARKLAV